MRLKSLTILFLFAMSGLLSAQYCGKVVYDQQDGLAEINQFVFQDSKGLLWVGSNREEVHQFDGKYWKIVPIAGGVIPGATKPLFEDKEGGLWFQHGISGVSRLINDSLQYYGVPGWVNKYAGREIKEFPFKNFDTYKLVVFYDKKKEVPVTFYQESDKQFLIFEFDFETQAFDLKGKPFFDQPVLEKYAPLMDNHRIDKGWLYVDWKGDYCVAVPHEEETLLVYQDGTVVNLPVTDLFESSWWIPDGEGSFHLYKKDRGKLLKWDDARWVVFPEPDLKRYGRDHKKTPMRFWGIIAPDIEVGGNKMYTLWQVEDPKFKDHFLIADHALFSNEITNTMLIREDERTWVNNRIFKDKAGTLWYWGRQKLNRLFPDQMIIPTHSQDMPSDAWAIAGTADSKMWISSYTTDTTQVGLHSFDGLNLEIPKGEMSSFYKFFRGRTTDEEGNIYFASDNIYHREDVGWSDISNRGILRFDDSETYELLCRGRRIYYMDWDNQEQLVLCTQSEGLWILPRGKNGEDLADWIKIDTTKGLKSPSLFTFLQDHNGYYWMGGNSLEVYRPDQDKIYSWLYGYGDELYTFSCMEEDGMGNLWFGSTKGLYFLENNKEIDSGFEIRNHWQFVAPDYFGGLAVKVCKLYDNRYLILGNDNGYYLLDLDSWYAEPRQLLIHPINKSNGHQGNGVFRNSHWIDHNKDVWLMCADGAVRYSPQLLQKDSVIPVVSIDSFEAGGLIFKDFTKKIRLGLTDRTVRIYFSHSSNPLLYDNVRFRYRLTGDENWSDLLNQNDINYLSLGPGDYSFEIFAEKNGLRSATKKLKFNIPAIFWQRPTFWLAILGGVILLALYLGRKELTIRAQELHMEKIKKEKGQLQIQALLNQLNPHFINNVLQWLQVRLDNHNDPEGVGVISKLSENILTVFKYSRAKKSYHSIQDELNLVRNYLYVQKQRFGKKLNYEIPDESAVQLLGEVNVPLFMILIHVENAIEHGIRNSPRGGTVRVMCFSKKESVILTIEDDGVGRRASAMIGSRGTGNGLKILKEFQALYNEQNEAAMSQEYEDDIFEDDNGHRYGTRMTIHIPRNYNFEI